MKTYQRDFIELARRLDVLKFGSFTLKSGRKSPYFFNAGSFSSGASLAALGESYARCIVDSGISFDVLLGPAYKGIPLASATAVALAKNHAIDAPFAYNRKEAKDHGEGGRLVGAELKGRVLIIDDVITAGTAVSEVVSLISAEGAELAGVVIGLNREEKGAGDLSAIQELEAKWAVPVLSIVSFSDLLSYLESGDGIEKSILQAMRSYRDLYGI
ncbi:MAG: orotate phosphoribosyltransferase [Pseudomonadota bacterium]